MQPTDRHAFADMLTKVMSYYARDTSTFLLDVFWSGLEHHELDVVRRAFQLHMTSPDNGQFPPKLSDISRYIEGSTQTQGMRAWATVEATIRSVGAYRSVVFDDPLVHVVIIEMGGWVTLCRCSVDELPFKAKDFERRYAAYRLRRDLPSFAACLVGESESENRLNGRNDYQVFPVLIGDPDRAIRVMSNGTLNSGIRITDARAVTTGALAQLTQRKLQHCGAAA